MRGHYVHVSIRDNKVPNIYLYICICVRVIVCGTIAYSINSIK